MTLVELIYDEWCPGWRQRAEKYRMLDALGPYPPWWRWLARHRWRRRAGRLFARVLDESVRRPWRPTFDHTRADGPFDPCPECLELMSRAELVALVTDMRKGIGLDYLKANLEAG